MHCTCPLLTQSGHWPDFSCRSPPPGRKVLGLGIHRQRVSRQRAHAAARVHHTSWWRSGSVAVRASHARSSHRSFGSDSWVCPPLTVCPNVPRPFARALRDLGYQEGRDFVIEYRWADGNYDRLPALLDDLIRLKVDVIVTHGTPGVLAAKAGHHHDPDRRSGLRRSIGDQVSCPA